MKNIKYFFFLHFTILFFATAFCDTTLNFTEKEQGNYIGKNVWILKDETSKLKINQVKNSDKFEQSFQDVPRFGFTKATIWVKFQIKNLTSASHLIIDLTAPLIDEAELFSLNTDTSFSSVLIGQNMVFSKRKYNHPNYLFDIYVKQDETKTYFMRIKSFDQIEIPIKINTPLFTVAAITIDNFILGIYCGIMFIMIFYNLFIYFSIRDKSYLYYVIYILFIFLTQTTFQGYTFKFLWPNCPKFEVQSILLLSVFVGFTSVQFLREFLHTKKHVPRLDKVFFIAYVLYALAGMLVIVGFYQIGWQLILAIVSPLSLYMLFIGFKIAVMGYRPAVFFSISWSIFLVGVFIYAMKDFGILPYNNFTVYTMPLGSAIETVLLSFALADSINIFKKEKEQSQHTALLALQENEKLITEQKVILEQKVNKRTIELSTTLVNLKDAQEQLINAEKMASIGQLTAGIAHEINNPINFVSANLKPLKMDISEILEVIKKYEAIQPNDILEDKLKEIEAYKKEIDLNYLKQEIETLLSGIEDGAKRTTEIVSGLKNFSRLDENEVKESNINEGIESTLTLLRHSIPKNIDVIVNLGNIPSIECLPGKLNQVFMNLLTNALYAINQKNAIERNKLIITTYMNDEHICASFEDTGIGMTKEVKNKIFDPFFTTKDVGEGTGLGMSIVYKIIETHHAKIDVDTEYGKGTKIVLTLNKKIDL
ncbi:MAG: 7TM diverse intracellular signaling domain-containing protein [Bacteroidia bacterium]